MLTDEEAKAVQEAAKTGSKALELLEKAGPFIVKVLGAPGESAVNILARRLAYYELVDFFRVVDKTKKLLSEWGITDARRVPLKLALPLLEAAALESDDDLQDMWARLLATAMDPSAEQIKRSYISILEEFEPDDAQVLLFVYQGLKGRELPDESWRISDGLNVSVAELAKHLDMVVDEVELCLSNLTRLGCTTLHLQLTWDGQPTSARTERAHLTVTALGKALIVACTE